MPARLLLVSFLGFVTACAPRDRTAELFTDAARWVDLTYPFNAATIYWPTAQGFQLEQVAEGETDAGYYYAANNFRAAEHGGTHLDAPVHFARGRHATDQIPLAQLMGPAVVVDVQRVGPSTGMPTKTEQGDLYLACYGGHGNCPRIVLGLTSVEDSFYGAMRAFNLAEQFQMPVVVLSDASLGHRKATVPVPDLSKVPVIERRKPTPEELVNGYQRYRYTSENISPMSIPGMEGGGYVAEGLEHDEGGYPAASNHENHLRATKKRYGKFMAVEAIANELVRFYGEEHPEIGIIGWGSTEGVIREAVQMARDKGYSVGALHPKILYPQPLAKLKTFIEGAKAVIIPEVNFSGQFATLLRKRFAYDFIQLNKCIGLPFTPKEIFDKIEEVAGHVAKPSGHRAYAAKL